MHNLLLTISLEDSIFQFRYEPELENTSAKTSGNGEPNRRSAAVVPSVRFKPYEYLSDPSAHNGVDAFVII
jgi:hypothetical protein